MLKNEFYETEIINYYSWIETIVKNSNSFGYTDINISLESLIVKLLKILDIGDYTNCNSISVSYPTIDLFDNYPVRQKIYSILCHKNYNPRSIDLATKNIDETIEDYVYQTFSIDECQESALGEQYNQMKDAICEDFKNYIKENNITITLMELNDIFDLIEKYDFSDYEESIKNHFQENQDKKNLSNDEIETITYLKEYSAAL